MVSAHPHRRGFGSELIEQGLPYQLSATTALEFAPGGIRCVINLPLGDIVDLPFVGAFETEDSPE